VSNFALCNLQHQFGMESEHHQVLMSTELNNTKEMLICCKLFFGTILFLRHQHLLEEKSQFVAFICFAKKKKSITHSLLWIFKKNPSPQKKKKKSKKKILKNDLSPATWTQHMDLRTFWGYRNLLACVAYDTCKLVFQWLLKTK
jgi:hypothetical protein